MRIEIDTLRDSQQDIRKAIEMLQSLVAQSTLPMSLNGGQQPRNIFESTNAPGSAQSLFGAIFDTPTHETKSEEVQPKIEYYR